MKLDLPPFSDGVSLCHKELLEYRGRNALIDLSSRRHIKSHMAGSLLAKTKGRGMEFEEARHYQIGDDIRAIDWRVTARTGKVHTKIYREERERPVYVMVDLNPNLYFGSQLLLKSVQACHVAALIGWSAVANGDRIGALLCNSLEHRELKPRNRHHGVLALIDYLVRIHNQGLEHFKTNQTGVNSFEQSCSRLRRVVKPGSLVFLISDFNQISDKAVKQLQHLGRHNEIIGCQINDPLDHQLPRDLSGSFAVTDGQVRQQFMVNPKQRTEYQRNALNHQQQQLSLLQKLNIATLNFSSHLPLLPQIKRPQQ